MYEGVVQDLIDELGRLPGVGPKSAQRIAFHLLQADPIDVKRLVSALVEVKDKVRFCSICGNVAQEEQCRICRDPRRDARADLRGRGAQGRRRDRAHPRVPGPLPRARRRDQPDRGHRPRRPAHPRAAGAAGLRRRSPRSSWPPTPTSRARRPRPTWRACCARWACGSPGWRRACRSAVTWSTPTRSPWAARSREGDCSMSDDLVPAGRGDGAGRPLLPGHRDHRGVGGVSRHRHPAAAAGRLTGPRRGRPARRHHRRRPGRALRGRPRSGRRRRPRCARAWPTCSRAWTTTPSSSTRSSASRSPAAPCPATSPS